MCVQTYRIFCSAWAAAGNNTSISHSAHACLAHLRQLAAYDLDAGK